VRSLFLFAFLYSLFLFFSGETRCVFFFSFFFFFFGDRGGGGPVSFFFYSFLFCGVRFPSLFPTDYGNDYFFFPSSAAPSGCRCAIFSFPLEEDGNEPLPLFHLLRLASFLETGKLSIPFFLLKVVLIFLSFSPGSFWR